MTLSPFISGYNPQPSRPTECHSWNIAFLVSASDREIGASSVKNVLQWCADFGANYFIRLTTDDLAMHSAIAEIVGWRLMQLLKIGCAPSVNIISADEARQRDPLTWIFKAIQGGRLKLTSRHGLASEWVVAVEKITMAVPLPYLRDKFAIAARKIDAEEDIDVDNFRIPMFYERTLDKNADLTALMSECARSSWRTIREIIWRGRKAIKNADTFYADFVPPQDWTAIKRSIDWDSNDMLNIHAARAFLGASVGHASNVLVDNVGRLYSIDHESCVRTDFTDLELLFENIPVGTKAFEALRRVAQITDRELLALFDDMPTPLPFAWTEKERAAAFTYYGVRLRRWRAGVASRASSVAAAVGGIR